MKRTDLPSVSTPVAEAKPKPKKRKPRRPKNVIVTEIPTKKTHSGYRTNSCFLRKLTAEQSRGLSLVFKGLQEAEVKLANKKAVKQKMIVIQ